MSNWSDPYELHVGDLVAYEGALEYSRLRHRIIYRVIKKEPTEGAFSGHKTRWTSDWRFTLELVLDLFPLSEYGSIKATPENDKSPCKHGSRNLRRFGVIELAQLRNKLDLLIADEVKIKSGEKTVEVGRHGGADPATSDTTSHSDPSS